MSENPMSKEDMDAVVNATRALLGGKITSEEGLLEQVYKDTDGRQGAQAGADNGATCPDNMNERDVPPTAKQLAKYVRKVAAKYGFDFTEGREDAIVKFRNPTDFHWIVKGEFPLILDGEKAKLKIRTRDVLYYNALKEEQDGYCRFCDVERELTLPRIEIGARYVWGDYANNIWQQKEKGTLCDISLYNERGKEIKSRLEEAGKSVRVNFPAAIEFLESPNFWAGNNYNDALSLPEGMSEESHRYASQFTFLMHRPVWQTIEKLYKGQLNDSGGD